MTVQCFDLLYPRRERIKWGKNDGVIRANNMKTVAVRYWLHDASMADCFTEACRCRQPRIHFWCVTTRLESMLVPRAIFFLFLSFSIFTLTDKSNRGIWRLLFHQSSHTNWFLNFSRSILILCLLPTGKSFLLRLVAKVWGVKQRLVRVTLIICIPSSQLTSTTRPGQKW